MRVVVILVVIFAAIAFMASNLLWFEYVRSIHEEKMILEADKNDEFSIYRRMLVSEKGKIQEELDIVKLEMNVVLEQKLDLEKKLVKMNLEFGQERNAQISKVERDAGIEQFENELSKLHHNPLAKISNIKGLNKDDLALIRKAQLMFLTKINSLQFPKDCSSENIVLCSPIDCGFGCMLHHYAYCLVYAYAKGKTMVLQTESISSYGNWRDYFEPESNCTESEQLHFRANRDYIEWLPEDIDEIISKVHSNPQLWFVGQIVAWLMRLNERALLGFKDATKSIGYYEHPLLALHCRGTDVSVEAPIIYLEEYIPFMKKINSSFYFLATDDNINIEQSKKYPEMKFLMFDRNYEKGVGTRFDLDFLVYEMFMIAFESDFFIGSDASQISRASYEMMQTRFINGADLAWSIHTLLKDKKEGFWWYLI